MKEASEIHNSVVTAKIFGNRDQMKMFESIKDQVKNAKKIVFVTGAGISQESGIPHLEAKMVFGETMML